MADKLRLMAVLAHPDDESMGAGAALAKYAAEGVDITLVTATRGEYGWMGDHDKMPPPDELGKMREGELRNAIKTLGFERLILLDYIDGYVDQADPAEAMAKIANAIREHRPQVVITFDQFGIYGHPDHIAVGQFTAGAVVLAADSNYSGSSLPSHRVSKFYVQGEIKGAGIFYEEHIGEIVMNIDGVERRMVEWVPWAFTTKIDGTAHWRQVRQAVMCHKSQLYESLLGDSIPDEIHEQVWSLNYFYRVFSLVNGGRAIEDDLFEGLR